MARSSSKTRFKRRSLAGRLLRWTCLVIIAVYAFWSVSLIAMRFVNPPITTVQLQRLVEGYGARREWVPLERISPALRHAVIAAEDARFYEHMGVDWKQVAVAAEDAMETGETPRGASTITQQLVKNLFFTTHRNPVRKVVEWTLAPVADLALGKERTLELYLNTAEWGPGVFGAEAAARHHFGISAAHLNRDQAARLAAVLPAPLRRRPARMNRYAATIEARMRQMGW
jgi:monofunctional glycosyltransferase